MRSHVTDAGSTRRWRKIRMAAIRRANFMCGRCGMQFAAARGSKCITFTGASWETSRPIFNAYVGRVMPASKGGCKPWRR